MGGVDIKKKPRAMSEMASESGSMICETCGKGYKHASCLSKHKYPPPHSDFPNPIKLPSVRDMPFFAFDRQAQWADRVVVRVANCVIV
jgi:ubiquitin C-terminal hydrolase